ncbi:uncharacterized protein FRV6_08038 [Fusarium oxysporum]|uniref:Uncharacterized protein n=1 Tax=Fusarium oxysporum TaxID=5507 RepID=A0A2H3TDU4_FUSOX|nr:uncharacterized protein FRV6_08038 [Fusarium oxysporum]
MEDPNLTEAPGAAQCPSSQSAELKDPSGRPHCDQPIVGATPLATPVVASEDDAESPGSTPLPSSAFKMADISDGNADLEGSSSVSHEEAVLNLEDKIRQFESQLRERNESSSVLTVPYPSLKRKMQDESYDPVSKKMKPASQVSLEMGSLSTEVAGRYMSVIHNEVFRISGRSGLINPADFDVGPDGVIGLSKHALKRVYSDDKS